MQRSITSRYALASTVAPGESVDITVIRHDSSDWRQSNIWFSLSVGLDPSSSVDAGIFHRGSTAISLQATFNPRTLEINIANIEGRSLERGQSFARRIYTDLLELTPECTSIVLYNITNSKAEAAVDQARACIEPACAKLPGLNTNRRAIDDALREWGGTREFVRQPMSPSAASTKANKR